MNSDYFESVYIGLIPTMTGNTTPSGEASCSDSQSLSNAYLAFDSGNMSYVTTRFNTYPDYVQYKFDEIIDTHILFAHFYIRDYGTDSSIATYNMTFQIYGSDDGNTFIKIYEEKMVYQANSQNYVNKKVKISMISNYKYYRLSYYKDEPKGVHTRFCIFQIYGLR